MEKRKKSERYINNNYKNRIIGFTKELNEEWARRNKAANRQPTIWDASKHNFDGNSMLTNEWFRLRWTRLLASTSMVCSVYCLPTAFAWFLLFCRVRCSNRKIDDMKQNYSVVYRAGPTKNINVNIWWQKDSADKHSSRVQILNWEVVWPPSLNSTPNATAQCGVLLADRVHTHTHKTKKSSK